MPCIARPPGATDGRFPEPFLALPDTGPMGPHTFAVVRQRVAQGCRCVLAMLLVLAGLAGWGRPTHAQPSATPQQAVAASADVGPAEIPMVRSRQDAAGLDDLELFVGRSGWIYLICGVLLAAGLVGASRMQRRRFIAAERARAREREQAQAWEIELAYKELKAAKERLRQQEKLASLGQIAAGIAHEIKNPLNFIANFAEVSDELADELGAALARGDDVDSLLDDLKQSAQVIRQQSHRVDAIIKSIMAHARGDGAAREAVAFNALVKEHVDLAYHGKRAQMTDFCAEVECDLGEDVGWVEVVPQEIGRVVVNLVGNAFDAMLEHAAHAGETYIPSVRVATRRVGDQVELRVEDNGPGIPEEVRSKIFEPFFTTKPPGSGTGLGLSLSYDIVTQGHGGSLTAESSGGQGAAFVVRLPAGVAACEVTQASL